MLGVCAHAGDPARIPSVPVGLKLLPRCKTIVEPVACKRPAADRVADAAVFYVRENAVRGVSGGSCSLREAGEKYGTSSIAAVSAAVKNLESTAAANVLREQLQAAASEEAATTTGAGPAVELTPKSAYKAAYKSATKLYHGAGRTLWGAHDTAMQQYGISPSIGTIRTCSNPGESPPARGRK